MMDELLAYRVEKLETLVSEQAKELAAIESRNAERDAERDKKERNQLIAGILFLGGVITTLATVIWNYRSVIFKGNP